jgi:hypothetical protein
MEHGRIFADSHPTGSVPSERKKVSSDPVYHVIRNGGTNIQLPFIICWALFQGKMAMNCKCMVSLPKLSALMVWELHTVWHTEAGRRDHTNFTSEFPIWAHKLLRQSYRQHWGFMNDVSDEAGP